MVKIYYFYGEPDYYIYGKNLFSLMVNNLLHLSLIFITFMVGITFMVIDFYYIYGGYYICGWLLHLWTISWRFPVVPTVHICHGWFLQVNNLLVVVQPIRVADASGCRNEQKEVLKAVVPFILFPISLLFYPSLPSHFNACSSWRSTKKFKTKLKVLDDRWTEVFFLVLERTLGAYLF